ncbi:MAG: hypothetical protein E7I88_10405 [Haemophilus parainfluenzae]|nr:hypothetical protein [Haemophilus parainfluenzae]
MAQQLKADQNQCHDDDLAKAMHFGKLHVSFLDLKTFWHYREQ